MTLKEEIIDCIENNNMNKMALLIDNSNGTFEFNFEDEEIFTIFKNSCNKDVTLGFKILYNKLKDKSYIHKNDEFLLEQLVKWGNQYSKMDLSKYTS